MFPQGVLHLFATNAEVNRFNELALSKLVTETATSIALDVCQGDATDAVKAAFKERVASLATSETYGLPHKLTLKVDGRYMMTNNVDTGDGLVNGATGTLRYIQYAKSAEGLVPVRLWIQFDDASVGRSKRGEYAQIARTLQIPLIWTPVDRLCRIAHRKQGGGNLQIMRKQFPLVAAMAITIHKSQGDTYSRVAVHLAPRMKRASMYVACSRAKTADGLYLIGDFSPPSAPSDKDLVVSEMVRLRQLKSVVHCIKFLDEHAGPGLKVVFHNVQSLRKHHRSMCADRSFMAADLILLVETRMRCGDNIQLPGFQCIHQGSSVPYGTSVYAKIDLERSMISSSIRHGVGHVELASVKAFKEGKTTYVTVVYKSPPTPQHVLMDILTDSVQNHSPHERVLYIGDFNLDATKAEGQALVQFMQQNSLLAVLPGGTPTTNQGTQIDQCFTNIVGAQAGTGESLTSYHKPIWIIV